MPAPAEQIKNLSSNDASLRLSAALALYRQGAAWGDAAIAPWKMDPLLSAMLGGTPTIGIAVSPDNFAAIRSSFSMPPLADVPPDQDAQEFELHLHVENQDVLLDILTTVDVQGRGAVARFLRKNGEGVQQVEYPVRDVAAATEIIRRRAALEPIYSEPHLGANGTRVNFFLAATPEGKKVLIELVEG